MTLLSKIPNTSHLYHSEAAHRPYAYSLPFSLSRISQTITAIACGSLKASQSLASGLRDMLQPRLQPGHVIPPKHISALLLFSALWSRAYGQNTFLKTFGGTGDDYASALALDASGNSVAAEFTTSFGAGGYDVLLAKWDANGTLTWAKTLGGTGDDGARALALDANGTIVAAGYTTSFGAGSNDLLLAKWDASGTLTWAKTLGGTGDDLAYALALDASGNSVAAGVTTSFGAGGGDVLLAKWDASGTLTWAKTLGGTNYDEARALALDASGSIVAAGYTNSFGAGGVDILLAKWDASGTLTWTKTLGGTNDDYAFALALDASGSIVAAGYTYSFGAGLADVLLAKWDASGTLTWAKTLGGTGDDFAYALALDASGSIVAAGYTYSFGASSNDLLLAKWDASGTLTWAKTLGGTNSDYADALALDASGNIIAAGYTSSFGAGGDVLLSRMNSDGVMYNCSYVQTANPTVMNQTAISTSTPSPTNQNWTSSTQLVWANVSVSTISSASEADQCLLLTTTGIVTTGTVTTGVGTTGVATTGAGTTGQASSTTGIATTGIATTGAATTGVGTTGSPTTGATSPDHKASSSSSASDSLPLIIGLAAGGGVLILGTGLGTLGLLLRRRKHAQTDKAKPVELSVTQAPASTQRESQISEQAAVKIEQSNNNDLRKDGGRTEIGNKYALVRKIKRKEVTELTKQTGIEITFPEGENKTKPLIGAGRFGKLRIAQRMADGQYVGVKKIKGAEEIAASQQEAALQIKLSDLPHVMPLLDSVETTGSNEKPVLYQFMPLAGFGSGETLQASLSKLSDIEMKRWILGHVAKSVLTGLAGMHSRGITHLDLKGSNIVLTQEGEVFIIDFGCAMESSNLSKLTGGNGDTAYFSPGRLAYYRHALNIKTSPYVAETYSGAASDLWALGIMLLEITYNKFPLEQVDLMHKLNTWDVETIYTQLEPALVSSEYTPLTSLIRQLLDADGKESVTASQLLSHALFSDPAYHFSDDATRTATFKKLKVSADKAPLKQIVYLKKSEDKQYIQSHYPKPAVAHAHVNKGESSVVHTYENAPDPNYELITSIVGEKPYITVPGPVLAGQQ